MKNIDTLKIGKLINLLNIAGSADLPVFVHGRPGIGKTEVVEQYANAIGATLTTFKLSLYDPSDIKGYGTIENRRTRFCPPSVLPSSDATDKHVVFFDELNTADTVVMNVAMQAFTERRLGEYVFPKHCHLVAAGNRAHDGAFVNALSSAMVSRFLHVTVESDLDSWLMRADSWGIHPAVRSFLAMRPKAFDVVSPAGEENVTVTPNPRAWARVSKLYRNATDREVLSSAVAGVVGQVEAKHFLACEAFIEKLPKLVGYTAWSRDDDVFRFLADLNVELLPRSVLLIAYQLDRDAMVSFAAGAAEFLRERGCPLAHETAAALIYAVQTHPLHADKTAFMRFKMQNSDWRTLNAIHA